MKIPTIKKFFNKTDIPAKKGTVLVAKVADKAKKTIPKKAGVKKVVQKKVATKTPTVIAKVNAKKSPKKVVTKKDVVVKKPVKNKSADKQTDKIKLVVASDSESFWVEDGQILNSLFALELALKTMPVATFKYHALTDGNHFADWVEAVLEDPVCAHGLRKAKTVKAAHIILKNHITLIS